MRFVVTALALLSMSSVATSKCALENHLIRGSALTNDGAPIANAKITATWVTKLKTEVVTVKTDAAGTFELAVAFDTFFGSSISGDTCRAKLSSIAVVATHAGHGKAQREVAAQQFDANLKLILR